MWVTNQEIRSWSVTVIVHCYSWSAQKFHFPLDYFGNILESHAYWSTSKTISSHNSNRFTLPFLLISEFFHMVLICITYNIKNNMAGYWNIGRLWNIYVRENVPQRTHFLTAGILFKKVLFLVYIYIYIYLYQLYKYYI